MTCIDVTVIFVFPNYPTMIGILLCDLAYFTQLRCWENINIYPQDDRWRATVKDGEVELSFDNLIYCMRFSRLRFSFFCYLIWRVVIGFLSPITPFFFSGLGLRFIREFISHSRTLWFVLCWKRDMSVLLRALKEFVFL
jgi:hypothetical protein